jgi:hypothetical protein
MTLCEVATTRLIPHRRAGLLGLGSALVAVLLAGCASPTASTSASQSTSVGPTGSASSTPTTPPTASTPAQLGCGAVPPSSGPASAVAKLLLDAPRRAQAGASVTVTSKLRVFANGARILTAPSMSELLITRGNQVVGKSTELRPDYVVSLQLRTGVLSPAPALPSTIELSGCPAADGRRPRLPAGRYGLVGVLGYHVNSLYGTVSPTMGPYTLVSEPAPVTID